MLVVFDLDGTLFCYRHFSSLVQRVCDENRIIAPSRERVEGLIGLPFDHYFQELFSEFNEDTRGKLTEQTRRYEIEFMDTHGEVYGGVEIMLRELAINHSLALCTNGGSEYVDKVLNTFKLSRYFDYISTYSDGGTKSERLGSLLSKNNFNSAVMIGDRVNDFEAARENQIPSIGVAYGFGAKDELDQATYIVSSANEILDLISRIDL